MKQKFLKVVKTHLQYHFDGTAEDLEKVKYYLSDEYKEKVINSSDL